MQSESMNGRTALAKACQMLQTTSFQTSLNKTSLQSTPSTRSPVGTSRRINSWRRRRGAKTRRRRRPLLLQGFLSRDWHFRRRLARLALAKDAGRGGELPQEALLLVEEERVVGRLEGCAKLVALEEGEEVEAVGECDEFRVRRLRPVH